LIIRIAFLWLERTMDRVAAVRVANMMIVCRSSTEFVHTIRKMEGLPAAQATFVIDAKTKEKASMRLPSSPMTRSCTPLRLDPLNKN